MASTRYGRIYHSNHDYINLRFLSTDARNTFTEKFNGYHDSHDHDGEAPRFEEINASEANKGAVKDVDSVTIDGYYAHEIEAYHEDEHGGRWVNYSPPTCCVAPLISVNRIIIASGALTRHELSAFFTDMPDDEYAALLESVKKDGFMDPVIRLIGDEVLDGWHRYSTAKELNLLRKLTFRQWDEEDEGDPAAFAYARNMARRHQDKAVRAQITVAFNKRFGLGINQHSERVHQNDEPKTREELAKEAGVSTATIDRAVQIEKVGESKAVIHGEKTAHEVLKEKKAAELAEKRQLALDAEHRMWNTLDEVAPDWDLDDFIAAACENHSHWGITEFPDTDETNIPEIWEGRFDLLRREIEEPATWIQQMLDKMAEPEQQPDNEPDSDPEDTVDSLWEKITPAISAWKADRKGQGVGYASKTMFISAIKCFDGELSKDSETDVVLLKKLLDLLNEVYGPAYTFERYIKMQCDGASIWNDANEDEDAHPEPKPDPEGCREILENTLQLQGELNSGNIDYRALGDRYHLMHDEIKKIADEVRAKAKLDTEKADALEKFGTQKRDLYARIHKTPLIEAKDEFGKVNSDKALHRVMLAGYKQYDLDDALLLSEKAIAALPVEEISSLTGKYFLMAQDFDEPVAEWVQALYDELGITQEEDESESEPTQKVLLSEWEEKWFPQIVDIFKANGADYPSGIIDMCIAQDSDYGYSPHELEVVDLKYLISDAETIVNHPEEPWTAWKHTDGDKDISWALRVLVMCSHQESEVDAFWARVDTEIPKWKAAHDGVEDASKDVLIDAIRQHLQNLRGSEGPATLKDVKELWWALRNDDIGTFARQVREVLTSTEDEAKSPVLATVQFHVTDIKGETSALTAFPVTDHTLSMRQFVDMVGELENHLASVGIVVRQETDGENPN